MINSRNEGLHLVIVMYSMDLWFMTVYINNYITELVAFITDIGP